MAHACAPLMSAEVMASSGIFGRPPLILQCAPGPLGREPMHIIRYALTPGILAASRLLQPSARERPTAYLTHIPPGSVAQVNTQAASKGTGCTRLKTIRQGSVPLTPLEKFP